MVIDTITSVLRWHEGLSLICQRRYKMKLSRQKDNTTWPPEAMTIILITSLPGTDCKDLQSATKNLPRNNPEYELLHDEMAI